MVARVQVPAVVKRGAIFAVRISIQHPMETGYRYDLGGRPIPKNVINSLIARYNGVEIFRAELGLGVAANPYLQFYAIAEASGAIEFFWVDDAGQRGSERAPIAVVA